MENVLKSFEMQEAVLPPYLQGLNEPQRQAVETVDGPVLVLSGAGTGKTRVLTTRIVHIIQQRKAWPSEILAVTFTNKAAREMAGRAATLLTREAAMPAEQGQDNNQTAANTPLPWLGTFHSISAKILRRHAEMLGFTSDFIILDTDDQLRLLKTILIERNIDVKKNPPKQYLYPIQQWKDRGLIPEKVSPKDLAFSGGKEVLDIYTEYQRRLLRLNAMDFGDLLLHNLTLFTRHEDVLRQYAERFKYIMVDEYQDTNIAQYLWLRLLALGHKNICCVGDDDQSIYGWRGAEVGNILKFEHDFPGAVVIKLEQNYRSTPQILAAASHLIDHNDTRLGKTLWTESKDGEPIYLQSAVDSEEEAYLVGEQIEYQRRQRHSYNEMAVLVRAGFQTRQFEERFLKLGLPYQVVGGLRFYERQEIKDAIAYLRLVQNPNDNLAFERIINTPKRGVGTATLEKLHSTARARNGSLYQALCELLGLSLALPGEEATYSPSAASMKGKVADELRHLVTQLQRWRQVQAHYPLGELTDIVLDESGYRAMWEKEKNAEANGRLENLRELVRAMGDFETLTAFLEHVGLVTDIAQQEAGSDGQMISLMTLHAAKGLEFDTVFLPGWEEGLFPHQRALDETGKNGLEEERRLAYVGITRARKRVYIFHAERRRFFTKNGAEWQQTIPSRFITELPMQHLESRDNPSSYNRLRQQRQDWGSDIASVMESAGSGFGNFPLKSASHTPAPIAPKRPAAAVTAGSVVTSRNNEFAPGTRVFHQKFGYGIVIKKQEDQLDIAFKDAGKKRIMSEFVTVA